MTTNVRAKEMPEFKAFRERLEQWALSALETENSNYVETFKKRMAQTGNDIELVIRETTPLLESDAAFRDVLTALLDVELWMDRCRRAVWYLRDGPVTGRPDTAHPGIWLIYHIDSWYLFAYGLLDRLRRLIALTCRRVIEPRSPKWKLVEKQLCDDIQRFKDVMDKTRNAIAHGGGSVEGICDDGLWEPYLMLPDVAGPTSEVDIIGSYYDSVVRFKARWFAAIEQSTIWLFAYSEAWLGKLRAEAFP